MDRNASFKSACIEGGKLSCPPARHKRACEMQEHFNQMANFTKCIPNFVKYFCQISRIQRLRLIYRTVVL